MQLKDQFQIKTVPAYEAADGQKFHDLAAAQYHTRINMLKATIRFAIKEDAQYAKLDPELLTSFLLLTGKQAGAIMAEPLEALLSEEIENRRMMATHVATIKGTITGEEAEKLRRFDSQRIDGQMLPRRTPMPQVLNPDVFANRELGQAMKNVEAEEELDNIEADIQRAMAQGA